MKVDDINYWCDFSDICMKTYYFCGGENHFINMLFEKKPKFNKLVKEIKLILRLNIGQLTTNRKRKVMPIDIQENVIMEEFAQTIIQKRQKVYALTS